MLTLTRKLGQSIEYVVPANQPTETKIIVQVNKIAKSIVRLTTDCPDEVVIHRAEREPNDAAIGAREGRE